MKCFVKQGDVFSREGDVFRGVFCREVGGTYLVEKGRAGDFSTCLGFVSLPGLCRLLGFVI